MNRTLLIAALIVSASPAAAQSTEQAKLARPPAISLGTPPARERALRVLEWHVAQLNREDAVRAKASERAATTQALYDLAVATPTGPERRAHPLAGLARSMQAAEAQEAGDNDAALKLSREATELLRPFRTAYPDYYLEAVSTTGFTLTQLGRNSEAAAALGEAADFAETRFATLSAADRKLDTWMALSNAQFANAQALYRLGNLETSAEYQRRSMQSRVDGLGADDPDTIASYYQYALSLMRIGRSEDAEHYARRALDGAIAHVDPKRSTYPRAFAAMGVVLANTGRRAEALGYMERALDAYRTTFGADNLNTQYAIGNLGDALLRLERYDDAIAVFDDGIAGFAAKQGKTSAPGAELIVSSGVADAAQGRAAAAEEKLRHGFDIARSLDAKEQVTGPTALPILIDLAVERGDGATARRWATQYHDEVTARPNPSAFDRADADLRLAIASPGSDPRPAARAMIAAIRRNVAIAETGDMSYMQRAALDVVLNVAARTGDAQIALDAMTLLAGSKIALAGRLVAQRLAAADPELGRLVRRYQDAARTYRSADAILPSTTAGASEIDEARRRRDAAFADLEAARAAIRARDPRWLDTRGYSEPDIAAVRAGLAPGEALVAIIPAFAHAYTLVVSKHGTRVESTTSGRATLERLVHRVRASLPTGRYDTEAASILHDQILTAGNRALLKGVDTLRVVSAGQLATLPFAALVERRGARLDRHTPYLLHRYAVVIQPDFLPHPNPKRVATAEYRVLAVGAPAIGIAPPPPVTPRATYRFFRGSSASPLSDLPPLPGAEAEVRQVAARFPAKDTTVLIGRDATEPRVRALPLDSYAMILFATHGLVAGELNSSSEPALVLSPTNQTDGLLTASEIATLPLNAEWVILSACSTAAGDGVTAPAYSGLAQAFRYAGARSLLLSNWPVRDDVASVITLATTRATRHGATPAQALRSAMRNLLHRRDFDGADDPFVWAPFMLLN